MSCRFAIATQTGPDSVALLARRPVLYVNVLRFSQFFFGTRLATWFPVRFVEAENQTPWSLAELAASPLLSAKDPRDFAESGVVFLRASADEVSAYVADYVNELENGADQPTTELRANVNRALQQHMRPWGESRFGEIVAKMSRKWLVDNQSWWLRNG
jgi:putative glycosyltransferase (TIGR04372 family)